MSKGQAHIMEYVLLTLFIVIIISVLIFFLTGWQLTQMRMTQSNTESEKALHVMKFMIKSPYFTSDESLFDDAKLDSFEEDYCDELNVVFGKDWFMEASFLDGSKTWTLCDEPGRKSFVYDLPVNIYRNSDNTNQLGILKVGIYHEESTD